MSETIVIRPYKESDIPSIAEIEKECFSQPWSINALHEFTENPFGRIIIAELAGKVAGYVTYSEIFEELQIANVAVSESFRRIGLGKRLIDNLIDIGNNKNAEIITLEVRTSNIAARALYEKCGFVSVGERKNFYSNPTENAVLMNYTFLS